MVLIKIMYTGREKTGEGGRGGARGREGEREGQRRENQQQLNLSLLATQK